MSNSYNLPNVQLLASTVTIFVWHTFASWQLAITHEVQILNLIKHGSEIRNRFDQRLLHLFLYGILFGLLFLLKSLWNQSTIMPDRPHNQGAHQYVKPHDNSKRKFFNLIPLYT
jgi:hypothetical protein